MELGFMGPALGGAVSGAFNLIGQGMATSAQAEANRLNMLNQQNINDQNYQRQWFENRRQEDFYFDNQNFQKYMSNTAYQRAMADMRAAGLNPILAYKQGGASAPGGSMPTMGQGGGSQASHFESTGKEAGRMMAGLGSSAVQAAGAVSQIELNRETSATKVTEQDLNKAQTVLSGANAAQAAANTAKTLHEADYWRENAINAGVQTDILKSDVHSAAAAARIKQREAEDAEKYGASVFGRGAATGERILDRIWNFLKQQPPPGGASPQSNPERGPGPLERWLDPNRDPNRPRR